MAKEKAAVTPAKFTKEQFLGSKKLPFNKDILATVLKDGKSYTQDEVKALVEQFKKKEVKK